MTFTIKYFQQIPDGTKNLISEYSDILSIELSRYNKYFKTLFPELFCKHNSFNHDKYWGNHILKQNIEGIKMT
jgi:hypothetical protein